MEFVVVSYVSKRDVLIDEQVAGQTGDTLEVETGHHKFTLSGPPDYAPRVIEKLVQNTTSVTPLFIREFLPK